MSSNTLSYVTQEVMYAFKIQGKEPGILFNNPAMMAAESEKMSFDEIFKSMVVYDDVQALEVLELLNICDLDGEGLSESNTAKTLGGLRCLWDNSFKRGLDIDSDYFIQAS